MKDKMEQQTQEKDTCKDMYEGYKIIIIPIEIDFEIK